MAPGGHGVSDELGGGGGILKLFEKLGGGGEDFAVGVIAETEVGGEAGFFAARPGSDTREDGGFQAGIGIFT